jgi:hypothetical protein
LTVKVAVVPANFTEVVVKPVPLKFEPLIVTGNADRAAVRRGNPEISAAGGDGEVEDRRFRRRRPLIFLSRPEARWP